MRIQITVQLRQYGSLWPYGGFQPLCMNVSEHSKYIVLLYIKILRYKSKSVLFELDILEITLREIVERSQEPGRMDDG